MEKDMYPILCGGTFLTLLIQFRKQPKELRKRYDSKNNNHRERDLLAGLIKISNYEKLEIDSQQDKSFKTITSKYIACTLNKSEYLPFTKPEMVNDFNRRIIDKTEYKIILGDMQAFTDDFIDAGTQGYKSKALVEILLDLIEFDLDIKDEDVFYVNLNGQGIRKDELCKLSREGMDVHLPVFLLGIWHFIVVNKKDNLKGKNTIDSWHTKPEVKGQLRKYTGFKRSDVVRNINMVDIEDTDSTTATSSHSDNLSIPYNPKCFDDDVDTQEADSTQDAIPLEQMLTIDRLSIFDNIDIEDEDFSLVNPFDALHLWKTINNNLTRPLSLTEKKKR